MVSKYTVRGGVVLVSLTNMEIFLLCALVFALCCFIRLVERTSTSSSPVIRNGVIKGAERITTNGKVCTVNEKSYPGEHLVIDNNIIYVDGEKVGVLA